MAIARDARVMNEPVLDADGHVPESTEQVARYLDEPSRRRPLNVPFSPTLDEIRNRGDITDAQAQRVLAGNCRRLYGL